MHEMINGNEKNEMHAKRRKKLTFDSTFTPNLGTEVEEPLSSKNDRLPAPRTPGLALQVVCHHPASRNSLCKLQLMSCLSV